MTKKNLKTLPADYWSPEVPKLPRLFLAPMEGLGDIFFRQAMSKIGGMDEMCTEFLRVPSNAHVRSLSKKFNPNELASSIPLACQIMGQDPDLLTQMGIHLYLRGAPRIDLNCGCPSNTVVGRGAGSSLLRTPDILYKIVRNMSSSIPIPVSVKIRSGFEDTSLFTEVLSAVQDAGASFITIHPRTKRQGYSGKANWQLIADAKKYLNIPVVGNGDLITVQDVLKLHQLSQCDGLMIGRGAIIRPWIFHEIKAHFSGAERPCPVKVSANFLNYFLDALIAADIPNKTKINKLKQCTNYLFQNNLPVSKEKKKLLRIQAEEANVFQKQILSKLEPHLALL
ncbi:MAG: tRNA-dihydrouridine synthase family protein [Chlamydiales bacterium]|nr:tRNA-dihydrouridine synthase family protein [Chlamydiales bacterium]NCF70863.1 tRNA-dihydrouridine synthase family protein [Chlamydiales bacterium]